MARVFQDTKQKRRLGSKAPWMVEWFDDQGRHSEKCGSKKLAQDVAAIKDAQRVQGRNGIIVKKSWDEFVKEYEEMQVPKSRSPKARYEVKRLLKKFAKTASVSRVSAITEKTLDEYVAKRSSDPGMKLKTGAKGKNPEKEPVSPETIKLELRTIRAALSKAKSWGYLAEVPAMPVVNGYTTEKPPMLPEDFDKILNALQLDPFPCKYPVLPHCTTSEWWDALLSLFWIAPCRISAMLELRWEDVDLDNLVIISRARDNKQKKDQRSAIVPVVAEKLHRIKGFGPLVFQWDYYISTLYREFRKIQVAAGIHVPCRADHEHSAKCHLYGFHAFRRSFATFNQHLPAAFQQSQMGHSSFSTTMRYQRYAQKQSVGFAAQLHLPSTLKAAEEIA